MNKMENKPFKGYIVIPRGIIFPFLGKPSHLLEFGVFIAIALECDWDWHHSTYGCLTKSDGELASRWGCNKSTIWRYKSKLIQLGLLVSQDKLIRVRYFEWFKVAFAKQLAKIPIATMQELIAKTQELIADMQENVAGLQDSQGQNKPQSFNVSSKGNLSLSNDDVGLSQDDIDWINKNIKAEK